ncbi:MAG: hypothetical protein WCB68_04340 [Pyrinomonadaceae bacterium]
MFVGFSKLKLRVSYVLLPVIMIALIVSYFYSAWAASKRFEAALPRDASDSIIKGLLAFENQAGRFPRTFTEVEERVWKHKKVPNFGETGRTLSAYNYHYIYFNKDAFTCTLWALPAGERRTEASSYFFYITTTSIRKWKGPDMNDDDIKKLSPTPDAALLGVLGMTEQPIIIIKTEKQDKQQNNPVLPGIK